jgi:hypothetical protein
MSKTQALIEARLRWGKQAVVRYNGKALTEPEKAPLRERYRALLAERTPENRQERDGLFSKLFTHRCDVGYVQSAMGICMFSVHGHGDTWEDAFARADRRR